ncbi:hypothetical protein [Calidifontibacter indicus]|uniref:hypothetical protein n=1 Tax=Calidifontibacter indicus TaxID=419650 RepID=UPI003D732DB4
MTNAEPEASSDETQRAAHTARIEAAVRRARRVETHSLVTDRDRLAAWAKQPMTVTRRDPGGVVRLSRTFPPVEPLESLAARVRPFLLSDDSIYYRHVLKSVGYFAHPDTEVRAELSKIKALSARLDRSNDDPLGAISQAGNDDGGFDDARTTKELGYVWLYSDLVHADDNERAAVEGFDIDHRYHAGCDLVIQAAVGVLALIYVIRMAYERGLLPIKPAVFAEQAEPCTQFDFEVVRMASALVGTPLDVLAAVLDGAAASSTDE